MYNRMGDDITRLAADNRRKRLNKEANNWVLGMTYDVLFGALPWTLGAALVALAFQLLAVAEPEVLKTYAVFSSPVAIGAISSFSAFLLVSKQSTALGNNARIIGEFGNAAGSCINLCLFIKSMMASGKTIEYLTLPDGKGSYYQTTRPALLCSSIMGVLKYSGRGTPIWPEGLALSQDPKLLAAFKMYLQPSNGSPGLAPFAALILMLGELVDEFQTGERASEYAIIFNQLNSITAAEGAISGTNGYSGPFIMDYMLIILYVLYLTLVIITNLVPENGYNAIWIAAILSFSTIGFMQVAVRYANPTKLRSRRSGQKPLVSITVMECEISLTGIFSKKQSRLINYDPNAKAAEPAPANSANPAAPVATGMSFRIV